MATTWIGNDEEPAMFNSDWWSANRSLVDPSIPTTSNGTEAYNLAFAKAVGNSAKHFWRTVQAIQDEESLARYTTMYTYTYVHLFTLCTARAACPCCR